MIFVIKKQIIFNKFYFFIIKKGALPNKAPLWQRKNQINFSSSAEVRSLCVTSS